VYAPDRSGIRLGFFWLSPGWTRGNAVTLWTGSLFTIGLAAFLGIGQPYLLNEVLRIPVDEQGRLTAVLGIAQETIIIVLAGLAGAWSDRVGRRLLYCLGLVLMGIGYLVLPLATTEWQLAVYRLLFATGVALAPLMMQASIVDASQESTRARFVGTNNLLQGLGVAVVVLVLGRSFNWFQAGGADPVGAARQAFGLAAMACLALAALLAVGLPRRTPGPAGQVTNESTLARLRTAARYAVSNPTLALTYAAGFIGRGDFVVVGVFVSLWVVQTGLDRGLTTAEATIKATQLVGAIQVAAVLFAVIMGVIADRLRRVTALCVALALAAAGYLLLGATADPFAASIWPVAVLVGMGEVAVIVASSALLGQEAPATGRGPVIGFFNSVGGIGILFATAAGGFVFDLVGRTAPFTLMGLLNLVLLGIALLVRWRTAPARAGAAPVPTTTGD
jgi:MFS family permease